ncbi:MAG: TonB-dependent receptor [Polaribacter sp.]|uniref:TonB-dependent receptor n=1 Tax=Polaribacter sp. TaxID=1920175 RepID=UPI002F35373D
MQIKLIFLIFFFSLSSFSQITGKVTTKKGEIISNAFVQLIEVETDFTQEYTSTDENGIFSLPFSVSQKKFYLKITLLGYKPKKVILNKNNISNIIISLIEDHNTLGEIIIITSYKEFEVNKDSINYNLSKVRDSTETNLKDLIEKLPGLTIDDNKKVSFQGNVIDKVLIDGEDFFGKKHEMSTGNLPAEAVQGIQIIKNFKEFDDIGNQKTGKIVLNITLNKNYKNKIVGNIEVNSGVDKKNQLHTNVFKFLKKGNFALITEANNIGESAINMLDYIEMQGGIGNFTNNFNDGGSGVYEIDHAKIPRYVFVNKNVDSRSTVFNSLNFSNKFSEKLKVNGYLTLDFTKIEELKNSSKTFISSNYETLQENKSNAADSYLGNSFVNIVYKKNENQVLKYNLKINPLRNKELFNIKGDLNLDNRIKDNDFSIGQSLMYKNQLSSKFLLQSFFSYDYKNQERVFILNSDTPFLNLKFYNDFTLTQNTNVKQNTININSKLLYNYSDYTKLTTSFSFIKNTENFNNNTKRQSEFLFNVLKEQNSFSYFNKINLKLSKTFSFNGSLNYIHNSLEVNKSDKKYNWFLPNISFGFEFLDNKNLSVSYLKTMKNIAIFQMNDNFRILNYQTKINKNRDIFTPIEKESINLNYSSINSSKNSMFSFGVSLFDTKNEIGYNSIVNNNFIEQNYVRIPKKGFDVSLNHSKTLKTLPFKWNAKIFYKNSRSFSFFEEIKNKNTNYSYGVDLRFNSTFKALPFQTKLNFYFDETKTKNDFSVLNYTLKRINIYPKIYGKINNFIWNFGGLYQNVSSTNVSQNTYAVNFSTQWNFNKEIQLFFKGTNILNLKNNKFISQQNTDAFLQLSTFERLEGNILIGMRFNF